jgi:LmbE family N-acetylglucosaminyl deacetylase
MNMKFLKQAADFFIPDCAPEDEAIRRTTHMAIAAHQDDIEIMAYDGILQCYGQQNQWFFGVVMTNGAGSPRTGLYADYTDEQMQAVRKTEQRKAAVIGEYGALAQLGYSSSAVKDPHDPAIIADLKNLISQARPQVIYTHNLTDKHDTHVAVSLRVIEAIRQLPVTDRPDHLYGCEVWRSLDWLNDEEKVVFDVSSHPNLGMSLLEVFDSQICGGKRYDLAAAGRRIANATYLKSHAADTMSAAIYAMNLMPLIQDDSVNIESYAESYIQKFMDDTTEKIRQFAAKS